MITSFSRWKPLCMALGLLSVCIPTHPQESSRNHSLRGGETETSRVLTGGGGDVTINFDELKRGDYVTTQYKQQYGLTFSSQGGCGNAPRIFDTRNPVTGNYGDSDLGSPNESCNGGGPGSGEGGKKGARGENCKALNNVLIIQECNKDAMNIPDDNKDGGTISLYFDPPAEFVYDMGFLDNDYGGHLFVEHGNGLKSSFTLPQLGDNAYEEADINLSNVRRITFVSERSGALVFIRFRPGQPAPTKPPERITDTVKIPFNSIFVTDINICFDPVAWCDIQVFDILMNALKDDSDLTPEQFDVLLNGLQALYCDAAASAVSAAFGVIRGEGTFTLSSIGGVVDRIELSAGLSAATLALADVDAKALASADAYAYVFAKAQDCTRYSKDSLKFHLCALAKGEAQSKAVAKARSYSSATALALSGAYTGADIRVVAERINEFYALVNTGVSSFAAADASATATTFAAAYAEALAKIKVSAKIQEYHSCRHKTRHRTKVCRYKNKCYYHYDWDCSGDCGWWTTVFSDKFTLKVESVSREVERSFAAALSSSLAAIDIDMMMKAYFKDGSPRDEIVFQSDGSVAIAATAQCFA